MVQRLQVLLGFQVLLGCCALLFFFVGCTPETLKIHVPPTGVQSVNQEDLRRAYWALEQGVDPVEWWSRRAKQFHLEEAEDCWQYTGQTDNINIVVAGQTPMQLTIMASLAKAVDRTVQEDSWQFCLLGAYDLLYPPKVDLTLRDGPAFTDVNFMMLEKDIQAILKQEMGLH